MTSPNILHGRFRFCPCCGAEFGIKRLDGVDRLVCRQCGFIFYQNPAPAVAVILLKGTDVLLVKRKYPPRAGFWSLPAGFVEYDEKVQETAVREIKEETNLDIRLGKLYGVFSANHDPGHHVLLVVYWGRIVDGELKAGDDALEACFFPLSHLPEEIAFSVHDQILNDLREQKMN